MADDSLSPQQLIDDAAKALGATPPALEVDQKKEPVEQIAPPVEQPLIPEPVSPAPIVPEVPFPVPAAPPETPAPEKIVSQEPVLNTDVPEMKPVEPVANIPLTDLSSPPLSPPPVPPTEITINNIQEPMVVPKNEKEEEKEKKENKPPKPEKKKGGKGILIATLLFFILTLPIAIYYVTQSPQFAEIRSRAAQTACTKGATSCKTFNGKNTGYQCTCFDPNTVGREQYTCKLNKDACPTEEGGGGIGGETQPTPNLSACSPLDRVLYTTGACASKGKVTSSWCPLDCGNLCCNRLDSVCCCMGCFPKNTDCSKAPYNCKNPPTVGCPKTTCYTGYPGSDVPHENCLVCSPDRTKLNTVTFATDGTVKIHFENVAAGTTVKLKKDGTEAAVTRINDANSSAVISAGTYTISVQLGNESGQNSLGFIKPDSNNKCGRYDPDNKRDVSSFITAAALASYGIDTLTGVNIPAQCWADKIQGEDTDQRGQLDANWDFNDFAVIIGYTSSVTPTATGTAEPGRCDASCSSDSGCESGLSCQTVTGVKRCRKSACPDELDCSCPEPTATPTPRPTSPPAVYNSPTPTTYRTPTPTTARLIVAPTEQPTPTDQPTPKIPVAGVGPGIVGAISVAGSILLLILGLAL